jgi:LuxR family maltose regulon positive regulatory protein
LSTDPPPLREGATGDPSPSLVEPLTDREEEVLALLAQRLTYKEIAAQLIISPGTVTQHVHNIYQKLEAKGRKQALAKATELGILSPNSKFVVRDQSRNPKNRT